MSERMDVENKAWEENPSEKGVCGWLSTEGEFIPSEYGRHDKVASEISHCLNGEKLFELLGYIKFTSRQTGVGTFESFVFFPQQFGCRSEITYSQLEWLEDNMDKMSARQKSCVMQYMYYIYGRDCAANLSFGY